MFRVTDFLKGEFEIEFIISRDVSLKVIEFLNSRDYTYSYHNTSNNIRKIFAGIFAARRLTKKREGLFVIWGHHLDSNRWLQFWLALTKREFIIVERLLPSHISELNKSKLVIPIKKFVVSRAKRVVICGESQLENYRAFFKAKNCIVISNSRDVNEIALETAKYRRENEKPTRLKGKVICCVGRLCDQKDQLTLIRAFAKISGKYLCSLLLVGEGENELLLKNEVRKLELENIIFTGFVTDTLKYLAIADIFVLPSLAEGLPGALIEAMAAGVACIATDIPGNRDLIIDRKTGLLIPVGDENALSAALEEYLNSTTLAQRMVENAFVYVEKKFAVTKEKGEWLNLFKEFNEGYERQNKI